MFRPTMSDEFFNLYELYNNGNKYAAKKLAAKDKNGNKVEKEAASDFEYWMWKHEQ